MAFFILRTHYPSGRTWANILLFVWLCVYSIKTGIRRIMRPDELRFVVRRSRRISKESSSRRIMRLVPVFILKTHNQMNYKCLPTLVKTNNAFSSIKTDNKRLPAFYMRTNEPKHSMYKSQPNLWTFLLHQKWHETCCEKRDSESQKQSEEKRAHYSPDIFTLEKTKHTKDLNELLAQVTNNLNYYFITWLA